MNAAIKCITLLACVAICSASPVKFCQCINTIKRVNPSNIPPNGVKEYGPRPYCRKQEVIVTLRNGKSYCLDPEEEFTKRLLQRTQMLRMTRADKANTMSPQSTTESATVSDTAASTASGTESDTASFTESAMVLATSS